MWAVAQTLWALGSAGGVAAAVYVAVPSRAERAGPRRRMHRHEEEGFDGGAAGAALAAGLVVLALLGLPTLADVARDALALWAWLRWACRILTTLAAVAAAAMGYRHLSGEPRDGAGWWEGWWADWRGTGGRARLRGIAHRAPERRPASPSEQATRVGAAPPGSARRRRAAPAATEQDRASGSLSLRRRPPPHTGDGITHRSAGADRSVGAAAQQQRHASPQPRRPVSPTRDTWIMGAADGQMTPGAREAEAHLLTRSVAKRSARGQRTEARPQPEPEATLRLEALEHEREVLEHEREVFEQEVRQQAARERAELQQMEAMAELLSPRSPDPQPDPQPDPEPEPEPLQRRPARQPVASPAGAHAGRARGTPRTPARSNAVARSSTPGSAGRRRRASGASREQSEQTGELVARARRTLAGLSASAATRSALAEPELEPAPREGTLVASRARDLRVLSPEARSLRHGALSVEEQLEAAKAERDRLRVLKRHQDARVAELSRPRSTERRRQLAAAKVERRPESPPFTGRRLSAQ